MDRGKKERLHRLMDVRHHVHTIGVPPPLQILDLLKGELGRHLVIRELGGLAAEWTGVWLLGAIR